MKPILKWAGGKTQLLERLSRYIPDHYGRYYEPFFGGGALYFSLQPTDAVINDFNPQLSNVYIQLKENPRALMNKLDELEKQYNDSREKLAVYYGNRDLFNQKLKADECDLDSAALLIFLNKAGFNGLYRVNASGTYNVPSAKKEWIKLYDPDNMYEVSQQLQTTEILTGDYEDAIGSPEPYSFVFLDPPYYETFENYTKGGFTEEDHKRLKEKMDELTRNKVYCILTNSNERFIRNLFRNYDIEVVDVKRNINRDGDARTGQEIIISNIKTVNKGW